MEIEPQGNQNRINDLRLKFLRKQLPTWKSFTIFT